MGSFSEMRLSVSPGLSVANLGDEGILLDPVSGNYFELNGVAMRILELAGDAPTVGAVVDQLLEEFEVERNRLEADVKVFIEDLSQRGLLEVG